MRASRVLAKTSVTAVNTSGAHWAHSGFGAWIRSIRRERPDGSIEEVRSLTNAVYYDNMTSIQFVVHALNVSIVWALFTLEFWD